MRTTLALWTAAPRAAPQPACRTPKGQTCFSSAQFPHSCLAAASAHRPCWPVTTLPPSRRQDGPAARNPVERLDPTAAPRSQFRLTLLPQSDVSGIHWADWQSAVRKQEAKVGDMPHEIYQCIY